MDKIKLDFVNIHGHPVILQELLHPKTGKVLKKPPAQKRAAPPARYHRGWSVVGVSPAAVEQAKKQREADIKDARQLNLKLTPDKKVKVPPPWDEQLWIKTAPLKPARTALFAVQESAQQCADFAQQAGWQRVMVKAIKKGSETQLQTLTLAGLLI
jgi:hypothetical protein